MSKIILFTFSCIAILTTTTGYILSKSEPGMTIKIHAKDLPENGLVIIKPSEPSFDERLSVLLKGKPNDVMHTLKPFSALVENKSERTVIAYLIQWCFAGAGGVNNCYRKISVDSAALMEGGLTEESDEQSVKIRPHAARLFSIVEPDGRGAFRVKVSREELEQFKQGKLDKSVILQRYDAELRKYTDITISIDGAFFDDGTFVGPDTTGFFSQIRAIVDARSDLLSDLRLESLKSGKSKNEVFKQVERLAQEPEIELSSQSTSTDYYNFYRRYYANEVLQLRKLYGDERGLAVALQPLKKAWPMLHKKQADF